MLIEIESKRFAVAFYRLRCCRYLLWAGSRFTYCPTYKYYRPITSVGKYRKLSSGGLLQGGSSSHIDPAERYADEDPLGGRVFGKAGIVWRCARYVSRDGRVKETAPIIERPKIAHR